MRLILAGLISFAASGAASADHYVNGYMRDNGTYVQPHYQTDSNASKYDNYSTQGNVNPYTGQAGTIDPYRDTTPRNNNYGVNNLNRYRY